MVHIRSVYCFVGLQRHIRKTFLVSIFCVVTTVFLWMCFPFNYDCDFTVTKHYFWYAENPDAVYDKRSIFHHRSKELDRPVTSTLLNTNNTGEVRYPWTSHPVIARAFTKQQRTELLSLVRTLGNLLEASNITYMMSFGTLLGSYFFHDIIPWDDDMDILVDIRDMDKLKTLFLNEAVRNKYGITSFGDPEDLWDMNYMKLEHMSNGLNPDIIKRKIYENIKGLGLKPIDENTIMKTVEDEHKSCMRWRRDMPRHYKGKFYALNGTKAGGYKWTWPFVDLIFYEHENDMICTLDIDNDRYKMCQKVSTVFPLHRRPLGDVWLPAPKDPRTNLKTRFRTFHCQYGTWDHVNERWHSRAYLRSPCKDMLLFYPHVRRECVNGKVREDLYFRDKHIQTVTMPEKCDNDHGHVFVL